MQFRTKKSLGQHFLSDNNMAEKIVNHLNASQNDLVIEIGPGTGALTQYLFRRFQNYYGIELDIRAIDVLKNEYEGIKIIESDILKIRFNDFRMEENQKIFIIGNIPYYITSPILFHLFDQYEQIEQAVLMIQKEVADRLIAEPRSKEYGVLSVQTQFYSDVKNVEFVPAQLFTPPPKVDSAVVSLTINNNLESVNIKKFKQLVRLAFSQRRKKLSNAIKSLITEENKDVFAPFLHKRAEELTVDEFVKLSNEI